jgi:hypothetical protein
MELPVLSGGHPLALRCKVRPVGYASRASHLAAERVQLPFDRLEKLVRLLGDRVAPEADPENAENKQGDAHYGQAPAAGHSPEPSESLRAGIEEHGEQEAGEHEKETARGAPQEEQADSRRERNRDNLERPPTET